jgi:hypothetical protein
MPLQSQAQRALMHGIATGSIPAGGSRPPLDVAKEFAASDQGGKLPAKAPKPAKSRASRLYKAKGIARG